MEKRSFVFFWAACAVVISAAESELVSEMGGTGTKATEKASKTASKEVLHLVKCNRFMGFPPYSVEDQGKGICFCTYCYNVQPGVAIDYATGDSHLSGKNNQNSHNSSAKEHASAVYILNTNTKKFHKPDCYSVKQMSSKNRKKYKGLRKKLIKDGYSPCKNCNP